MFRRSTFPLLLGLVASCGRSPTPPAADPQSAALDQVMNDVLAKRELPAASLVVVKGAQVVHSRGYGKADLATDRPMTDTTPTVIGSTSKPLTALGVLRLVQLGRVALDTPIVRYLPDLRFTDPRAAAITARHLLTNRAGIVAGFSGPAFARPAPQGDDAVEQIARESARYPLEFAPGTGYRYSNRGWLLAGYLIQKVAGEPVETFMQREVFAPLGMTQTTLDFWKVANLVTGYEEGYLVRNQERPASLHRGYGPSGMVVSTPRDIGRLLVAMLNGGKTVSGTQFLTPELIAEALRPQAEAESELGGPTRYSLGWEVDSAFGTLTVKKAGSVGTMVSLWILLPTQRTAVGFTFNREDYQAVPVVQQVLKVLAGGAAEPLPAGTWTAPAQPTAATVRPDALADAVGDYDTRFGDMTVFRRGDSLLANYEGTEVALIPASDTGVTMWSDLVRVAGKPLLFRRRGTAMTLWGGPNDSLGIKVR
ncbi:MAG: serine hydrolase domain-containing protein [Gemmatimonadales bacterium]